MALRISLAVAVLALSGLRAHAQSCQTSGDMDAATRTAVTAAGQHFFGMAVAGDTAGLRQNSIAGLASDFSGIESAVHERQADLAGATGAVKSVFLLEAEGKDSVPHAEFFCGVFGKNGQTPGSAAFVFDNLPPGKYAVAILDASSAKARTSFSVILQLVGTDWKLAGLDVAPAQIAGHDGDWYTARAREYKTKGQMLNAWLFYLQARRLLSPLSFMSTMATDRLYDEFQTAQPADFPSGGKTSNLTAGAATYKLTALFAAAVGNDLDLIVKYEAADISNTNQAYQNNVAVMTALMAKYPELRGVFAGVVARAVDPSGRDYGTLLAMKDIK